MAREGLRDVEGLDGGVRREMDVQELKDEDAKGEDLTEEDVKDEDA